MAHLCCSCVPPFAAVNQLYCGYLLYTAFLISNEEGFFISVGKTNEFEFLELSNISVEDTDDNIEIEEDLDFSMF